MSELSLYVQGVTLYTAKNLINYLYVVHIDRGLTSMSLTYVPMQKAAQQLNSLPVYYPWKSSTVSSTL